MILAVDRNYIASNRDTVIRFGIAYLPGAKEFNAAAMDPDRQPGILAILAKGTVLNKPELLKAIAPDWSRSSTRPYVIANGEPLLPSGAGWGAQAYNLLLQ